MTNPALCAPVEGVLSLHVVASTATVTIGTGDRRNALSPQDWHELEYIAASIAARTDLKSVVFRGAAGTFSAGSDLRFWDGATPEAIDENFARIESSLAVIERIPVPTIAVVEGVAAGAGCELALACDLRIFSQTAQIGLPIVQLGVLVSPHFVLRLTLLVGVARARELLYTGRLVSADEANRIGLATIVVSGEHVDVELERMLDVISRQPLRGLSAVKEASSVALDDLRERHDFPDWAFSDPQELPSRIRAFFTR